MKSTVEVKKTANKGSESGLKVKAKRHLGSLSLDESQLAAIKDWKVGEEYELLIKVRQTGLREVDSWDIEQHGLTKGMVQGNFEILSASTKTEGSEKDEK